MANKPTIEPISLMNASEESSEGKMTYVVANQPLLSSAAQKLGNSFLEKGTERTLEIIMRDLNPKLEVVKVVVTKTRNGTERTRNIPCFN